MSEVRPQLLITLVHGTWPRGLFPKIARFKQWVRRLLRRKHLGPPPFWFEEGSPFWARLSTELGNIPHKITPLIWSGANSIFVRDKTAHALVEHLLAEHSEHPQATQLVIAHSHGGNIALRALNHLQKHEEAKSSNPLVVTLAAPFIEIHQANFGNRPTIIRWMLIAIMMCLAIVVSYLLRDMVLLIAGALLVPPISLWWFARRAILRQYKVKRLSDATRIFDMTLSQSRRSLVIRAVDDEASLILAVDAALNYLISRLLTYTFFLFVVGFVAALWLSVGIFAGVPDSRSINHSLLDSIWWRAIAWTSIILVTSIPAGILLLIMLALSRSVHGRELAVSPMDCQINTQSTPDADSLSKTVTLVRRTYTKSLSLQFGAHGCALPGRRQ